MKFQVIGNRIIKTGEKAVLAEGDTDVVCEFCFDAAYDGMDLFAVLYRGKNMKSLLELRDRKCVIPWEFCAEKGVFYVGVLGLQMEGTGLKRRLTSNAVFVRVVPAKESEI